MAANMNGDRALALREKKGLTFRELASQMGKSRSGARHIYLRAKNAGENAGTLSGMLSTRAINVLKRAMHTEKIPTPEELRKFITGNADWRSGVMLAKGGGARTLYAIEEFAVREGIINEKDYFSIAKHASVEAGAVLKCAFRKAHPTISDLEGLIRNDPQWRGRLREVSGFTIRALIDIDGIAYEHGILQARTRYLHGSGLSAAALVLLKRILGTDFPTHDGLVGYIRRNPNWKHSVKGLPGATDGAIGEIQEYYGGAGCA